jgi:hypothetical protein
MNSLKVGAVLVVLVLLVFGFTVVSMYTGTPADTGDDKPGQVTGDPLAFTAQEIGFDPTADHPSKALFPGFYEPGEQLQPVAFWFHNPHPVPVRVGAVYRSCNACTSVRIGVVPPGRYEEFQRRTAADAVVQGFRGLPGLPVNGPAAGAALLDGMAWQDLDFDHQDRLAVVPAAPEGGVTWGVLVMYIKVSAVGPKTLGASIMTAAGDSPPVRKDFQVAMYGMNPFEVFPRSIALGELSETAEPQTHTLFYWSATRDPADLPPPREEEAADPFVRRGAPVPLDPAERDALAANLAGKGAAVRVRSGYKVPVTVLRRDPSPKPGAPAEPDIGPFERKVVVTGPANTTQAVTISGRVTGLVALIDGQAVDLKDFDGRFGTTKAATLVSDRPDLALALLPEEVRPAYLRVELSDPQAVGQRRHWSVKVTVPGGATTDELPKDAVLAFKATTKAGTQKVRIPVTGRAYSR